MRLGLLAAGSCALAHGMAILAACLPPEKVGREGNTTRCSARAAPAATAMRT